MKTIILDRISENEHHTQGNLRLFDSFDELVFECLTLELPWLDNETSISSIPPGEYQVVKHVSPSLGDVLWIQDVPGREYIYFHVGNYVSASGGPNEVRGCILVGDTYGDINLDGIDDILNSRNTFDQFFSAVGEEPCRLIIEED